MAGTTNDKNLFGKLLLPGFADAGASTSFHPISSSAPPATIAEDQLSEAPTEIHDNRTSSLSDRQQKQEKEQQLLYRQKSHDEGNIKGFFPTTKPPKSPRPVSPPIVMRQQLPSSSTNSVAGSSVVPETGSYKMQSGKQEEESRQQEEEQEATTKSKYWKQEELSDGPQPLEQQVEDG